MEELTGLQPEPSPGRSTLHPCVARSRVRIPPRSNKLWLIFQAAQECPSEVGVSRFNHLNPSQTQRAPELGSSRGEHGVRGARWTLGTGAPEGNAAEEPARTQPLPGQPNWPGEFILV